MDGADTTRDAVAAAFKEVQSREPTPAPEPAAEPAPEPASTAPEPEAAEPSKDSKVRDGKGRFIVPPKQKPAEQGKHPAASSGAPAPTGQGGAVSVPPPVAGVAPPASPALEALKPPQDWRATAREKWGSLPREVQEEALRLHVETKKTLSEAAELRKSFQTYQQATQPYEGMIRAEGLEPAQAVGLLLQREAALRTAPMQTRAQIIAHGIKTFLGTDDNAIQLLADALDRGPAQQGQSRAPQQMDPNQIIAQAEQRLMQRMTEARNQQLTSSAQSEIEAFAQSHEFLDEPDPETGLTVADEMASLMSAAADRGKALSPDDAYKLAIRRHSVANKIVQQREAAKAATAKAATTQAARAASSSIKSEPSSPANGKPRDVREAVSQAYYAQKNAH
jgi:hypothetical protein